MARTIKPKRATKISRPALLIGTTKGGFILKPRGAAWTLEGPFYLGSKVNDFRLDPRDGRTLLLASNGGHLGPALYRSTNRGKTWAEAKSPPAFGKASKANKFIGTSRGKTVKAYFWLQPGREFESGTWWCGTIGTGLFRSDDGGMTWRGANGFNEDPSWSKWTADGDAGTPDGSMVHSIVLDPRDDRHMYVGASSGGVFESFDDGESWTPMNRGIDTTGILPPGEHEFGHDPHCVVAAPSDPDRLYRQDHCGFYVLDRGKSDAWKRVGKKLPKDVGDVGFGVAAHPTDRDVAWMFPMDGTSLWPRTSPGAKPAVYRTADGGKTWKRGDRGLPRKHGYFTVKRQALCADDVAAAPGVYFGTSGGEIWGSFDGGKSFAQLAAHLPHVYSIRTARFRR